MRKAVVSCCVCVMLSLVLVLSACGGGGDKSVVIVDPPPPAGYSNSNINGTYVLSANGAGAAGTMTLAALFTANGQGGVSGGTLVTNVLGNVQQASETTFTGTYNVTSDGRGTMTITPANGQAMDLRFVITASGINVIRFNMDAVARGFIQKQSMGSVSAMNGRYVLNLDGYVGNVGDIHEQHSAGTMGINGGEVWTVREVVTVAPSIEETSVDDIGAFTLNSNGLGSATLNAGETSLHLRVFVVSSDKVVLIADQSGTMLSGIADRQTSEGSSPTLATLSGNYVFLTQGADGLPQMRWVGIGRMTADGKGGLTGVRDTSGLPTNDVKAPFTATYAMIADGHGTMTIPDGPTLHIYTVSADKVLMIGSGLNTYAYGVMQKQSAGPFSTAALTGKFGTAIGGGSAWVSGIWNADGKGVLSGTVDVYNNGTLSSGQPITGAYNIDSTGRGDITVVSNALAAGVMGRFYLVSPNEVWVMSTEPSDIIGVGQKQ